MLSIAGALARTVIPTGSGYSFRHATFSPAARKMLGQVEIAPTQSRLDEWAESFRASHWAKETPAFLRRPYTEYLRRRTLAATPDRASAADQVFRTVASPGRWTAIFLAEGSPVGANTEVIETQNATRKYGDEGLLGPTELNRRLAILGLCRRGGIRGLVT